MGELRRLHDVEQAIAEELLDGGPVVLAQAPGDPMGELLDQCDLGAGSLGRDFQTSGATLDRLGGLIDEEVVEAGSDDGQAVLVDRLIEGDKELLDRPLAHDQDEAREPILERHEVDPADTGGPWPWRESRGRPSG